MECLNYPEPTGFEIIQDFNGKKYTLKEVLNAKINLQEIMSDVHEFLSSNNIVINEIWVT